MQEVYPFSLALYDFVPVSFFVIGSIFLVRLAARLCGDRCGRLATAGALLVFAGGFVKAVWKLLFTLGVGDFQWLSDMQFPLVAPGFLILLIPVIMLARSDRNAEKRLAHLTPAIAAWKIPLLFLMTLASLGVQGILTYTAFRRGAKLAAAGFILAFISLIGMGALASAEQTLANQWIAQSVNTAGQLGFMIGSLLLYRDVAGSQTSP